MSPENTESRIPLSQMVLDLRTTIERFHNRGVGEKDLIFVAQNVWNSIMKDVETKSLWDAKVRAMRVAVAGILGGIDVSKGDPIERRFNPYKWFEKIPKEYENRESEYVLARAEAFLDLIENLDS